MGDTVTRLIEGVRSLEADALSLGLKLNHAKCEVLGLSKEGQKIWQSSGLNFALIESESACFLGSPLGTEGVDEALKAKSQELNEISPRLAKLSSHEAFYLLKASFGMPRLLYLMRSAPTFGSSDLPPLSSRIRELLSGTLNVQLEDDAWAQASLPVRWGGLGVRDVVGVSASAFLSSRAATASLVERILPLTATSVSDNMDREHVAIRGFRHACQCGWTGEFVGLTAIHHWVELWEQGIGASVGG